MTITQKFRPQTTNGAALPSPYQVASADGAINIAEGTVYVTKGSAAALTIASPPLELDGAVLNIVAISAHAHTVTYATVGFNGGGASTDVATFGGAKGDSMVLTAYQGVWYTVGGLRNVTLG
jgi:hypothetical protein